MAIFGRKTRDGHKNTRDACLAEEYLAKISQEEKDAFTHYLSDNGMKIYDFTSMNDGHAMLFINRFRSMDWYRKYAEICNLRVQLDPSAKSSYNARMGRFLGSVEISILWGRPVIKGYCHNCGRQLIDYDHCYENEDGMLCFRCFDLFKRFTPVMIHHCPGCVDTANSFTYHVWAGWDDFLTKCPPEKGWHYEWSQNHLMTVRDDHDMWWVLWNIHHPDILREVMNRCPEFHHQ